MDFSAPSGFTLHERCVALLAATRDSGLMARSSFFQLVNSRNAFAAGSPTHVTAHEEIVVARVGKADESAAEAWQRLRCVRLQ